MILTIDFGYLQRIKREVKVLQKIRILGPPCFRKKIRIFENLFHCTGIVIGTISGQNFNSMGLYLLKLLPQIHPK